MRSASIVLRRRRTPPAPSLVAPREFFVPTGRASLVAACWIAWFAYHSATFTGYRPVGAVPGRLPRVIEGRAARGLPVRGLHADGSNVEYRCHVGENVTRPKGYRLWGGLRGIRLPLPHPLNGTGVLDFAVHVSKNELRTLIVGNSLGEQLHHGLEEAMCFPLNTSEIETPDVMRKLSATKIDPAQERREWALRKSRCATSYADNIDWNWMREPRIVRTEDGGILGVVKDNLNMISTEKWNRYNPAIISLLGALKDSFIGNPGKGNSTRDGKTVPLLDVFIYQFQSGHIDLIDFHERHLDQAMLVASNLFGARAVIFPTIAWMNNVNTSRVDAWWDVNNRIRSYAKRYRQRGSSSVASVQALDIAKLSKAYIEKNARILGIPIKKTYSLRVESIWKTLVAMMCASLPFEDDPRGCSPGMVSLDGMHLCPETFHGRINAALICLLDCRFNRQLLPEDLQGCSDSCNSKFMNLHPLQFRYDTDLIEEMRLT